MSNIYQFLDAVLLNNEVRTFAVVGKYIRVITWNSATPLKISFDGSTFHNINAGMYIKLPDTEASFTLIYLQNLTGGNLLVELGVSSGEIGDNRLTVTGVVTSSFPGLAVAAGYDLVAISNVAATQIVAANAARRSILIRNLATNGGNMYLGFTNAVTALKYIICLTPGEFYSNSDYTGAIFALSTVLNEKVSYGEV